MQMSSVAWCKGGQLERGGGGGGGGRGCPLLVTLRC